MVETITESGIVLSSMPIGEYDRRLVILTQTKGKITAFARGARKPTSAFSAGSQPMAIGNYTMYRGRNSYTVTGISVKEFFGEKLKTIEQIYMGMYFLEVASYFSREDLESGDMLNLLYCALKALSLGKMKPSIIRRAYEYRMLVINGLYFDPFSCVICGKKENLAYYDKKRYGLTCKDCGGKIKVSESAIYALQFIATCPVSKLFSFDLKDDVKAQIDEIVQDSMDKHVDRKFNSLEFLNF